MKDDTSEPFSSAAAREPDELAIRLEFTDEHRVESTLEHTSMDSLRRTGAKVSSARFKRWSTSPILNEDDRKAIAALLLPAAEQRSQFKRLVRNGTRSEGELRVVVTPVSSDGAFELDAIPWEAGLYVLLGSLAPFGAQISFVRREADAPREPDRMLFSRSPLRIVATDAHEVDGYPRIPLAPMSDTRIRGYGHTVTAVIANTPSGQQLFNDPGIRHGQKFDLFHFSGHGMEQGLLVNARRALTGPFLGAKLRSHGVRLAVLIACNSASGDTTQKGRLGVASHVGQEVPAVVGMQREILDTDAADFVDEFYEGMRVGGSLDHAFAAARHRLHEDDRPFWIPVVYLAQGIRNTSIPEPMGPDYGPPPLEHEPVHAMESGGNVRLLVGRGRGGVRLVPAQTRIASSDSQVALSSDGLVAASMSPDGLRVHWADEFDSDGQPVAPDGIGVGGRLLAVRRQHASMAQLILATEKRVLTIVQRANGTWSSPEVLVDQSGVVAAAWVDRDLVLVDEKGFAESLHLDAPGFGTLETVAGIDSTTVPDGSVLVGWGTSAAGRRAFVVLGRAAGHDVWEPLLEREEEVLAVGIVRPPRVLPRPAEIRLALRTKSGMRVETIGMQWTARI